MQWSSCVAGLCALAAAAAAVAAGGWYCCWRLAYWRRRGVPQPGRAHWLFGHYRDGVLLRAPPARLLGRLYRASSAPLLGFYIFHKPCLLLRDPDLIKRIFVTDFDNFADRNFAGAEEKDSFGMMNLFGLRGEAWRYMRRRVGPALAAPRMRAQLPLLLAATRPMLRHAARAARAGRPLDAQELSHRLAADIIASVALGTPTDSFANPDAYTTAALDFFGGIRRMLSLLVVFFVPWLPTLAARLRLPLYYEFGAARALFWRAWRAREAAGAGAARGDFLDTLLALKNGPQNPLYEFSGENLLYTVGMFYSGFESSAGAAAFALAELARRPALAARARAEVRRAVAARGWAAAALADMPLLARCLRETLRLHPPLPVLDRIAKEDYQIPGTDVVIEKGVAVYVSVDGLQTDPRYFPEPAAFDPDRLAAGRAAPAAYMPFGRGPRMCASVRGGELHALLVLAAVLHHFELSAPAPPAAPAPAAPPLDPRSTFTLAAGGMPVLFRKLDTTLEPHNII